MAKVTISQLQEKKDKGERITMLTAYDVTFVRILDSAGIDAVLVGDSLGMVIKGDQNTLSVTMEDMIYHSQIVSRGVKHSHLMVDMPFMSYQISPEQALSNAGRLVKEAGAESVKLEGGTEICDHVRRITQAGIPVMAHIGLKPQSIHQMGGFKIQGREATQAQKLKEEARALCEAGAFGLLLEGIPARLASEITSEVPIPTIGIGAGAGCDGQVLVIYDLLGMDNKFNPKFAKKYANLHDVILDAVKSYIDEVKTGAFPTEEHSFK